MLGYVPVVDHTLHHFRRQFKCQNLFDVEFSSDEKTLVLAMSEKGVAIIDVVTGATQRQIRLKENPLAYALAISPDKEYLAIGHLKGEEIVDMKPSGCKRVFIQYNKTKEGTTYKIIQVRISAKGTFYSIMMDIINKDNKVTNTYYQMYPLPSATVPPKKREIPKPYTHNMGKPYEFYDMSFSKDEEFFAVGCNKSVKIHQRKKDNTTAPWDFKTNYIKQSDLVGFPNAAKAMKTNVRL